MDYIRDGEAIYQRSFALIEAEANLESLPSDLVPVAIRLIHACGMVDIVKDLAASPGAAIVGKQALKQGASVLCDTQMVADGVICSRLPAANRVICTLKRPEVSNLAAKIGNTRSAAAVELWQPYIDGAVVAIGNAPTALFHLLELLEAGLSSPALILGFPVGFVGASEAKVALANYSEDLPFITLHGRRGGSAMAAAAVNALSGSLKI